jgi:virginiamycin B lyase
VRRSPQLALTPLRALGLAAGALGLAAGALAPSAAIADPTITEFPPPAIAGFSAPGFSPEGIVTGPDGKLWITQTNNPGFVDAISADASSATQYAGGSTPGFGANNRPGQIALGADGNLWMAEGSGGVAKISPSGAFKEFSIGPNGPAAGQFGVAAGPDGATWFTEKSNPGRVGRITPAGQVTELTGGSTPGFIANLSPTGVVTGPDNHIWFTQSAAPGAVGHVNGDGTVTEYAAGVTPGFTANMNPQLIAAGPDGSLWFAEAGLGPVGSGAIARITPAGVVTEFNTGLSAGFQPYAIAAGSDGNLWFTEVSHAGAVGRITPQGVITEFVAGVTQGLTPGRSPEEIAPGPDGNMWFTEGAGGWVARITIAPGVNTGQARSISSSVATLQGKVRPNSQTTSYAAELGTTTAYGTMLGGSGSLAGAGQVWVAVPASGLAPSTTYHFRVRATNPSGTTLGSDQTFTTPAGPAPALTQLRVSPRAFRASPAGGALVSYVDSAPATTTLTMFSKVPGNRVKRSHRIECGPAQRQPGRPHPPACVLLVRLRSFTHVDVVGLNRLRLSGLLHGHTLSPGAYELRAQPRDKLGHKGNVVTADFVIVP